MMNEYHSNQIIVHSIDPKRPLICDDLCDCGVLSRSAVLEGDRFLMDWRKEKCLSVSSDAETRNTRAEQLPELPGYVFTYVGTLTKATHEVEGDDVAFWKSDM